MKNIIWGCVGGRRRRRSEGVELNFSGRLTRPIYNYPHVTSDHEAVIL